MYTIERIENHSFFSDPLGPGSVVLDLGLNRGVFAVEVIKRFKSRVIGLEPAPDLFMNLPASPLLEAHNMAIGDSPNVVLSLNESSCSSAHPSLKEPEARQIEVAGISLDSLLDAEELSVIALGKVDIEGAEIDMFLGASDSALLAFRQLTVEFHDFLDPALAASVDKVIRRLCTGLGFRRIEFSRGREDVLFLNSAFPIGRVELALTRGPVKYLRGIKRMAARKGRKGFLNQLVETGIPQRQVAPARIETSHASLLPEATVL